MKKLFSMPTIVGTSLLIITLTQTNPALAVRNIIQNPLILCQEKTSLIQLNNDLKSDNTKDLNSIYDKKKCLIFPPKQGLEYNVADMPDKNGIVTLDIFILGKQDRAYTYESWLKDSSLKDRDK